MSKKKPLIIDNGSYEMKAGFAGKKKPELVFPTIVASELAIASESIAGDSNYFVGKEALKKIKEAKKSKKLFNLRYPVQRGMIMDFEQMEHTWKHVLKSLNTEANAQPILLTAQHFTPEAQREGMAELFFEVLGSEELFIETPALLSFMRGASGEDNGIICDLGGSVSSVTPIVNGRVSFKNACKFAVSGTDLSLHVSRLLGDCGYVLDPQEEYRVIQHVKQNMAYVCQDLKFELEGYRDDPKKFEQELELPSGEKIFLSKECFLTCEALFDISLCGGMQPLNNAHNSIHSCVMDIIAKTAPSGGDLEKAMYSNIVVSGGSAMFPGLTDRMDREIRAQIKKTADLKSKIKKVAIKTVDPIEQSAHAAWLGASDWCSAALQGDAQINWISRQDYNEVGASIVKKRCF